MRWTRKKLIAYALECAVRDREAFIEAIKHTDMLEAVEESEMLITKFKELQNELGYRSLVDVLCDSANYVVMGVPGDYQKLEEMAKKQ